MHIAQLEVDAGVQLADNKFHFDEHVNLFIGPNSSGKTSILRMLSNPPHEPPGPYYQHLGWRFGVKPSDDWARWIGEHEEAIIDWSSVPFIQVGAIRIGLPISERRSNSLRHDYSNSTLKEIFEHCYETNVFDANAMETALQLMIVEARQKPRTGRGLSSLINGEPARRSLQQAIDMSHQCAQRICSEVVKGQTAGNVVNHGTDHGVLCDATRNTPSTIHPNSRRRRARHRVPQFRHSVIAPMDKIPRTKHGASLPIHRRLAEPAKHSSHRRDRKPPAPHLAAPSDPSTTRALPKIADIRHYSLALSDSRVESGSSTPVEPQRQRPRHRDHQHRRYRRMDGR